MSFSPCFGYHSWRKKSSSARPYPIGNRDPPYNVLLIELTLFTSFSVSDILLFFSPRSQLRIMNGYLTLRFTVNCIADLILTSLPLRIVWRLRAMLQPHRVFLTLIFSSTLLITVTCIVYEIFVYLALESWTNIMMLITVRTSYSSSYTIDPVHILIHSTSTGKHCSHSLSTGDPRNLDHKSVRFS